MHIPRPSFVNAVGLIGLGAVLACGTALLTSGCGASGSDTGLAERVAISRDEPTPTPSPSPSDDIVVVEDPRVGTAGTPSPSPSPSP